MLLTMLFFKKLIKHFSKKLKRWENMKKREISVNNEIHKKLWELKIKYNFKRLEDVIAFLIKKAEAEA